MVGSLSYSLKSLMLSFSRFTIFVSLCRFQAYLKEKKKKKGLIVQKRLPTLRPYLISLKINADED